jgi:hypothetical protein
LMCSIRYSLYNDSRLADGGSANLPEI